MRTSRAFEVLGCSAEVPTKADVKSCYRLLAARAHPDHGGSAEAMAELTDAYETALRVTERPVKCPGCGGSGSAVVSQRGFNIVTARCSLCRGSGLIARELATAHGSGVSQDNRNGSYRDLTDVHFVPRCKYGFDVAQVRAALASFQAWRDPPSISDPITIEQLSAWLATLEVKGV